MPIFPLHPVLDWHLSAGADETIENVPVNRINSKIGVLTKVEKITSPMKDLGPVIFKEQTAALPSSSHNSEIKKTAYALAKKAPSIDELRGILEKFDGCSLKKTSTNLVFCDGTPNAKLMLIGEAPGAQEDREGVPFIGSSGQLLNKMLASISLNRTDVIISNTVFWRPPGNRTPTLEEISICQPFLDRLIQLANPDILVALGGPAAKTLLNETQAISKLRGRWFKYKNCSTQKSIEATAIFHPAYLLRTPRQKSTAWNDLLSISSKLSSKS